MSKAHSERFIKLPINLVLPQPAIDMMGGQFLQEELSTLTPGQSTVEICENKSSEQSIFESYDPHNEMHRLKEIGLTPELEEYYIKENILSYCEEFAAHIKSKRLAGVLKDDGSLEILGTNVTQMYRETAQLAQPGSREWLEMTGLDKITSGLMHDTNHAIWVSPPKVSNYGFVFHFSVGKHDPALGGRPLSEKLLRYDDSLGSISKSKGVFDSFNEKVAHSNSPSPQNLSDFLETPLLYASENTEDLAVLNTLLEISDDDLVASEEYRKLLLPTIQPVISEYVALLQEWKHADEFADESTTNKYYSQAQLLIGGMFNMARAVSRKMHTQDNGNDTQDQRDEQLIGLFIEAGHDQQLLYAAAVQAVTHERLTITGGSQCPSLRSVGSRESSVIADVRNGAFITDAMERVGLGDDALSGVENVKIRCPDCGEQHLYKVSKMRSEGGIRCDCGKFESCWEPIVIGALRLQSLQN